jgi:DNA replication initiation complex subunit (GINS family)
MTLTLDQIRDLLIDEKAIPAFCEVPADLVDQYHTATLDLKQSAMGADRDAMEVALAREESMRYTWEDLIKVRLGKLVGCAREEAETGSRPDLSGMLVWEHQVYDMIVEDMMRYMQFAGVTST